jgi:oligopeptide transport system ATP-binding protein
MAVMYFGRIVELGPTDAVVRRRYHPYTRALFAAMPRADEAVPSKRRLQVVPEGDAPSPLDPPRGCAFFGRCPSAEPGLCDTQTPALSELVEGTHHRVACWHPNAD